MALTNKEAYKIRVTGIVQGVGFRPFVYGLAKSLFLCGKVLNEGADVVIFIEGEKDGINAFFTKLEKEPPVLSVIQSISKEEVKIEGYIDFSIVESQKGEGSVYISPDTSICKDCESEMLDKNDRRYLYPFINCTNCGPRFTIIKGVPYDRPLTTMATFEMCEDCKEEYTNPENRRYHAQPVCCPKCGPKLILQDNQGVEINNTMVNIFVTHDIVDYSIKLLKQGKIFAVKGLGGFHLVCDAKNEEAVKELRRRKVRDDKPFAVMMRDIDTVKKYCKINDKEIELLTSEKKPIVLLKKAINLLPDAIASNNPFIGVMLPYTPVHLLFFQGESKGLEVIVATSANKSNEPIFYKDEHALAELGEIADFYLTNDRDIYIRTDDSVTRVFNDKEYIIRRARGYVPMPMVVSKVLISEKALKMPQILACGGELKSTFCLSKGKDFFLSHHIGDLENTETLTSFEEGIEHFKKLFEIQPEVVAYDLHPEYLSTKYAKELNIVNKIGVQHHHAHIAACMAENNMTEEVIGIAFDGTGYGLDGNLWGGEFFVGDLKGFKRIGQFDYVKLPGGEKAIKEPWRTAISYLKNVGRMSDDYFLDRAKNFGVSINEMTFLLKMLDKSINSPLTSSAGRLFDAVAALSGIRNKINYEGQAAIELEFAADVSFTKSFGYDIQKNNELYMIKPQQMFLDIANELESGKDVSEISGRFHHTMAYIVRDLCLKIKKETGIKKVVLSGGVFQNITLLTNVIEQLEREGLKVYTHSRIPANDGCISFGQAVMAAKLY